MDVPPFCSLPTDLLFLICQDSSETRYTTYDLKIIGRLEQVCKHFLRTFEIKATDNPYTILFRQRFSALKEIGDNPRNFYHTKRNELAAFTLNERIVVAANRGYEKQIRPLFDAKADVNYSLRCIGPSSQTPEISESPVEVLRTYDFYVDGRPHTPLTCAIREAHVPCVEALLATGKIDLTMENLKNGVTALSYAFSRSFGYAESNLRNESLQKIIGQLLDAKSPIKPNFAKIVLQEFDFQNEKYRSLICLQWLPKLRELCPTIDLNPFLFLVCELGSETDLKLLLGLIDINGVNSEGDTPLHICCRKGHIPCVRILLSCQTISPFPKTLEKTPLEFYWEIATDRDEIEEIVKSFLFHPQTSAIDIYGFSSYFAEHCSKKDPLYQKIDLCIGDALVNQLFSEDESETLLEPSPKKCRFESPEKYNFHF